MRSDYSSAIQKFQELPQDKDRRCLVSTVPTFYDCDSRQQEVHISQVGTKSEDPFLYYSNDEVRLRILTGRTTSPESEAKGSQGRVQETTGTDDRVIIRKTRLSFEVHPSLFFDDDEDIFSDRVDNEVVKKVAAENPQLASLVDVLFGDLEANTCYPRAA